MGRHHRRWVGQVFHRQASLQVGGAGLSQAGIIAGGWGRSHRQASLQVGGADLSQAGFSANFDNPARCVTYIQYIYIYIYNIYTVEPLYYKPLKCGNLYNKDTILCPSEVLKCIK